MKSYNFLLRFKLTHTDYDPTTYLSGLAGRNDSPIGQGQDGRIALFFSRKSDSATTAIASTIDDVMQGVPGCILLSAELVA